MDAWVLWALIAVALAVGEIFTPGLFFLGPVALAAVVSAIVAAAGLGGAVQLIVFIVAAVASVGLIRPIAKAHIRVPPLLRTGTAALVGAQATVVQRVDSDGGRIKLAGEEWTARAYLDGQVLEPGTRVEVAKIEGATALVYE
jgi:membrane protein implicated in regulation of membrane protease activity